MGLQVWLPLNGNVNNQGLASNLTFQSLNATVNTAGKIGNCYSFNATNASIDAVHDKSMWRGKPVSYALWFKSDESKASGTILEIGADLCVNYTYADNLVKFGYWRSYTNTSGGRSGDRQYSQKTYDSSKWHHITITFNGGIIKLYVDGTLDTSWDRSSLYTDNNPFLLAANYNRIALGRSYGSTSFIGGLANDLRIYDHCLSPEEVKWISQGLTLHYPLSNRGFGGDNLLPYVSNSDYGSTAVEKTHTFTGWDKYCTINIGNNNINWNDHVGEYITYSCYMENVSQTSGTGTGIMIHVVFADGTYQQFYGGKNGAISQFLAQGESGFLHITTKVPNPATRTNPTTISYIRASIRHNTNNGNSTVKVKLNKFEFGDHPTPWIPNSSDPLYSSLQLDSTTEFDCSGYQHNGEKHGTISYDYIDTPLHHCCTHLMSTSSYIKIDGLNTSGFGNTYTFSWWAKVNSVTPMHWGFSNGVRLNGMYTGHLWNTGDSSDNPLYKPGTTTQVTNPTINVWHHWVMTGDGTTCKVYQDGELFGVAKTYKPISGTTIYINGWDASTSYSASDLRMSDFRFYYTELNADAIKELYMMRDEI